MSEADGGAKLRLSNPASENIVSVLFIERNGPSKGNCSSGNC